VYEYNVTVKKVVDGNTLDVDVDLGFGVKITQRLRLARIDAYETRAIKGTTPEDKKMGMEAKQFVIDTLSGKTISIMTKKDRTGKYGRFIVEVFYFRDEDNIEEAEINLNDKLVELGYAKFVKF
jgi:micrococcal nuclease